MAYLGFVNHILTSIITGGGSDVSNLQSRIGKDRWSTGVNVAGGAYLNIDSGDAETVWRAVAAFQTNFSLDAVMVIKLGTTAGDDDVYNSGTIDGVVAGRNYLTHVMAQDYAARYLRIELTDTDNPDSRLDVGFVYAGPMAEVSPGVTYGSSHGLEVTGTSTRTLGGQEYTLAGFTRYGWDLNFGNVPDDAMQSLVMPFTRYAAGGENVLFIPYSDGTRLMSEAVYGRPIQTARVSVQTANFNSNIWTFQISDRL